MTEPLNPFAPRDSGPAQPVPAGSSGPTYLPATGGTFGGAITSTLPGAVPDGGVASSDIDPIFDADWTKSRRGNRATAWLVAGLVAAGTFAGGAYLQRQHDAGLIPTARSGTGRTGAQGGAFPGGGAFPSGGGAFPGGGGFAPPADAQAGGPGGQVLGTVPDGAANGTGNGSANGSGNGAAPSSVADSPPVVVGTVKAIKGDTVTVVNFAGKEVAVRLTATTTVTATGSVTLQVGVPVSVRGTKAADGSVTATAIVGRKAGS